MSGTVRWPSSGAINAKTTDSGSGEQADERMDRVDTGPGDTASGLGGVGAWCPERGASGPALGEGSATRASPSGWEAGGSAGRVPLGVDRGIPVWTQVRPEVGEGGLEPPHPFGHRNLNPARLPIPPLARATSRGYPNLWTRESRNGHHRRKRKPPPTALAGFRLPPRVLSNSHGKRALRISPLMYPLPGGRHR